jgi:hypothetical protein
MLTKLRIIAYAAPITAEPNQLDSGTEAGQLVKARLSEFVAYFNPESLSIQVGRKVKETSTQDGKSSSHHLGIDQTTYSFKLLIDGTGVSGPKIPSVKAEVDKFIAFSQLGAENAGVRNVPFLELVWGDFYVQCQLESVTVNYTLFDPNGRPLRASMDCSFSEYMPQASTQEKAPDLTTQISLKAGESLLSVVGQQANGMVQVVNIARKNDLDSIRGAHTGATLLL